MANGEHFHAVAAFGHAVERDIAGPAMGDHQFALPSAHGTADVRMAFQNFYCVDDDLRRVVRGLRIDADEEIEQSLEIGQGARAVDDAGHGL